MRRRTLGLVVAAATMAAVAVPLGGAVTANASTPTAIASIQSTAGLTAAYGTPLHDDGDVTVSPQGGNGIMFSLPPQDGVAQDFTNVLITPPTGTRFTPGHFTLVGGTGTGSDAGMQLTRNGESESISGELDVLDAATNSSGTLTRLDAVFLTNPYDNIQAWFGEVRMGEPEQAVRLSQNHVLFPTTPVKGTPIWLEESVRNTASTAVPVGDPTVTSGATGDYRIASDTCPASLAAGASCTFRVGFSPTVGGPRDATLSMSIAGTTRTVDLTGAAPLGISRITASGYSWLKGKKVTQADGPYEIAGPGTVGMGGFMQWGVDAPYDAEVPGTQVQLSAPAGTTTFTTGTHALSYLGDRTVDGILFAMNGEGCGAITDSGQLASMRVYDFTFDPDNEVDHAHITWTSNCSESGTKETGELLWHHRSDYVAPTAVTHLWASTSTHTVRWAQSASTDTVRDVVRLVPGTGAGATPTSGIGVSFTLGTSATLPTLVHGQKYAVAVFPVDKVGNVGKADLASITG